MSVLPSSLAALYVFNPTLGEEETEHRKILYFAPKLELNAQKDFVGISEGLIAFTRDFSPNKPCEAVRCEQQRWAFYEAEKDFWIVLVVKNPSVARDLDPITNKPSTEYLEEELEDSVLQSIIRRAYSLFRLFNGRFQDVAATESIEALRTRLSVFMHFFIQTVHFKQLRFFTDIHGFQFLPVDKATFLTIQYLVNTVRSQLPLVQASAVMFNGQLIWSGINQDDMFLLYLLDQDVMRHFYTYLAYNSTLGDFLKANAHTLRMTPSPAPGAAGGGGGGGGSTSSTNVSPRSHVQDSDDHSGGPVHSVSVSSTTDGRAPTEPSSNQQSSISSNGSERKAAAGPRPASTRTSDAAGAAPDDVKEADQDPDSDLMPDGATGDVDGSIAGGAHPRKPSPAVRTAASKVPKSGSSTAPAPSPTAAGGAGTTAAAGADSSIRNDDDDTLDAAQRGGSAAGPSSMYSTEDTLSFRGAVSLPPLPPRSLPDAGFLTGPLRACEPDFRSGSSTPTGVSSLPSTSASAAAVQQPGVATSQSALPRHQSSKTFTGKLPMFGVAKPSSTLSPPRSVLQNVSSQLAGSLPLSPSALDQSRAGALSPPPQVSSPPPAGTHTLPSPIGSTASSMAGHSVRGPGSMHSGPGRTMSTHTGQYFFGGPPPRIFLSSPLPGAGRPSTSTATASAAIPAPGQAPLSVASSSTVQPPYRLVAYQRHKVMVFLIVLESPDQEWATVGWHQKLEEYLSPELQKLSTLLTAQIAKPLQTTEEQYRFLYFNHMNLALKTTLNIKSAPLSMATIKLIRNIHADFTAATASNNQKSSASEVCVRTSANGWVVGRRANESHREFFVLIDDKSGSITDVQDEVDRLAKAYFYNIFIH